MISKHASVPRRGLLALVVTFAVAGLLALPSARADNAPEQSASATEAISGWLQGIDGGAYAQSWTDAGKLFQDKVSSGQWEAALKQARQPLGACKSRVLASTSAQKDLPGGLKGEFVIARYDSSFEHLTHALETVTMAKEADGKWRSIGYFIQPAPTK